MNDLQCRRIKHAASMALNIDDRLDDIEKAALYIWEHPMALDIDEHAGEIEKSVNRIRKRLEDITHDLLAIRNAEEAEADEATPAPTTPETAAGPFEPYSDEAYERLRNGRGQVMAAKWTGLFVKSWLYSIMSDAPHRPQPDMIARIYPPKGGSDNGPDV